MEFHLCVRTHEELLNTNGTLVMLEEAAQAGVKKLVLSSSAAIYGDNPVVPKVETMVPESKSPYAITTSWTANTTARCLAILYLVWLDRTAPEVSCAAVFSKAEWKSVWRVVTGRALPPRPPKLHEFIRSLARLGGHLNRKNDGEVGIERMWIALQRMRDFALAWEEFGT